MSTKNGKLLLVVCLSYLSAVALILIELFLFTSQINVINVLLLGVLVLMTTSFLCYIYLERGRRLYLYLTILGALPLLGAALFLSLFMIVNYPAAGSEVLLEKRLAVELPNQEQVDRYKYIQELLGKQHPCLIVESTLEDATVDYFSLECQLMRLAVLHAVATSNYASQFIKKGGEVMKPWNEKTAFSNPKILRDIIRSELETLRQEKLVSISADLNLLELYRFVESYLTLKNELVGVLIGFSLIDELCEYYQQHQFEDEFIKIEIGWIIEQLSSKLADAMERAFVFEYYEHKAAVFMSSMLTYQELEWGDSLRWNIKDAASLYLRQWPFFDRYKTMLTLERYFTDLIELNSRIDYQEAEEVEALLRVFNDSMEKRIHLSRIKFENPYGIYLLQMSLPNYTSYIMRRMKVEYALRKLH